MKSIQTQKGISKHGRADIPITIYDPTFQTSRYNQQIQNFEPLFTILGSTPSFILRNALKYSVSRNKLFPWVTI